MSILRLFAVIMIFVVVSIAWMILGGSVWMRTEKLDRSLFAEMTYLWGPERLVQTSPYWTTAPGKEVASEPVAGPHVPGYWATAPGKTVASPGGEPPAASRISVGIQHKHRYKGLLWYSTFVADFKASYTFEAAEGGDVNGLFCFHLPEGVTSYDNLEVTLDGEPVSVPVADVAAGRIAVAVKRDARHVVSVRYVAGGQDEWLYAPGNLADSHRYRGKSPSIAGSEKLNSLTDFSLTVTTDFREIDYPAGTRSPNAPAAANDGGMTAVWRFDKALTRQAMGITMPRRANAGPIVARMSFFAPVSLLFFLAVLLAVVMLKRIALHPMHYLFIAAGFFAFHILLAYLTDVVTIRPAFWIAAVVSVLLVASYMRLVVGAKLALVHVALAQLVYQVGFSYAFFWVGRTGLTVTIGAILTLFALMQATGRVKWSEVFDRPG